MKPEHIPVPAIRVEKGLEMAGENILDAAEEIVELLERRLPSYPGISAAELAYTLKKTGRELLESYDRVLGIFHVLAPAKTTPTQRRAYTVLARLRETGDQITPHVPAAQ